MTYHQLIWRIPLLPLEPISVNVQRRYELHTAVQETLQPRITQVVVSANTGMLTLTLEPALTKQYIVHWVLTYLCPFRDGLKKILS